MNIVDPILRCATSVRLGVLSAGEVLAFAPSPLVGEGCSEFQRTRMGEGGHE